MAADFEKLSRTVLQLTEAVGSGEVSATDALVRLEADVAECCDLAAIKAIWQVGCMGSEVLAVLVPEKKEIVLMRDDGSTPDDEGIPPEVLAQVMIHFILRGMERHYPRGNCSAGSSALLAVCPNPIPKTDCPYADSGTVTWDHTQRRFIDRNRTATRDEMVHVRRVIAEAFPDLVPVFGGHGAHGGHRARAITRSPFAFATIAEHTTRTPFGSCPSA